MFYIILFFLSVLLTYVIKHYANKKSILDIPNERSSHEKPTPRGGGLAIVIVFYVGLIYLHESIDTKLLYALLCGIPIMIISLVDDIFTLTAKVRLIVQSISTVMALYFLGGVSSIDFILFELDGFWLNILAFIAMLWITNLYNFLDGIDGYAGMEAVTLGLGLAFLFHNNLGFVMIAASLGFLLFNWHRASIFMGDVGSATLGFIFAVFVFYDTSEGNILIWLILLSLFWFDATVTLLRRYRNAESIMQAHKKHAYQRLVQSGWSHSKVVLSALIFNLFFLVLLFFSKNIGFVFILNSIALMVLLKLIDKEKAFK